jgi:hypothetical protein
MLVIQADGSLGFLLPSDVATWNQTRAPLPRGVARPALACDEQ